MAENLQNKISKCIRFLDDSSYLFEDCKARNIGLSCIDTSSIIKTDDMFKNCIVKVIGFNM